jgi:(p)ppGpp synthase/HD superfamily hydrolase
MTLPAGLDENALHSLDTVERAATLAAFAHAGQVDKSGVPYFLHPLRASQWFAVGEHRERAATILHDIIEDTDVTYEDLTPLFEPAITAAVLAVTRVKGQSDVAYLAQIIKAGPRAIRVKIADSQDNLLSWRVSAIEDEVVAARLKAKYETFFVILNAALDGKATQ